MKRSETGIRRYSRAAMILILLYLMIAVLADLRAWKIESRVDEREYRIELNRACSEVTMEGKIIDFSKYHYVTRTEFLPDGYTNEQLASFLTMENANFYVAALPESSSNSFVKIYYQIRTSKTLQKGFIIMMVTEAAGFLFLCLVFVYVGEKVVLPFTRIQSMPYKLAKGTLTKALPESRNKYFGKFMWGLDMLREKLEFQKKKELELEKDKKTLLLSISHDIKTPLSTIKMGVRALQVGLYHSQKKQEEVLQNISKSATAIDNRVNEIMEAAKLDFFSFDVKEESFYLKAVISQIKDYYQEKMILNHVDFQTADYDNCMLTGDEDRLIEVLQNLIDNAFKYGDGRNIWVEASQEENFEKITVRNTGNTLPKEEQVHVFESFYRGSNVSGKQGSGLGLYISRQIMNRMKGEVFMEASGTEMKVSVLIPMR